MEMLTYLRGQTSTVLGRMDASFHDCVYHTCAHMYTGTHIAHIHTHANTSCEKTHSQPCALPSPHEPWKGCLYHHAHFPDEGIGVKHRLDLQRPTASKRCPGSSLSLGHNLRLPRSCPVLWGQQLSSWGMQSPLRPPRTSRLGCGASLLTARALNSDVTERPPMSSMAESEGGQGLPYRPR